MVDHKDDYLTRLKTPPKQKSWNMSTFSKSENKMLKDYVEEYYTQNPGAKRRDWKDGIMTTCFELAGKAENPDAVWYRLCRNQELEHSTDFIGKLTTEYLEMYDDRRK